jgi:ribosomal protein S18 acetylase RimI-like enzyme
MTLDIRVAKPADAERLADLARRTFVDAFRDFNTPENMALYVNAAFTTEKLLSELQDGASTYIWAEQTGIPAGYAKLRRGTIRGCVTGPRPVELERMYAETDKIGAGVGKTLLHTAIKIAQAEGYHSLWLGVWEFNERAIEFYLVS